MIVKHKIVYEGNEAVLCVYLSENSEEFAREYGEHDNDGEQKGLLNQVKKYLDDQQVSFTGKVVKVIAGSLVVATMLFNPFSGGDVQASITGPTTTYTVQSGDSLSVIAKQYNTSVDSLKTVNNLTTDTIYIGQTLKIASETSTSVSGSTYTVVSGDNLSVIASRTGLTVNQLKTYNNLTSDVIHPGQVLMLQQSAEVGTYTVKSGDSLWTIAQKYGMSVNDLRELNNVSDTIYPGQTLKVVQAAGTTTATTTTANTYTVASGDSLWAIANRNGITVNQLKTANNLTSDVLQPGQTLTIPSSGTQTPTQTTEQAPVQNVTVRVRRASGVVQSIPLEQYLVGVVASEIPPHFDDEAFKAQALAARTYAVSKTNQGVILYDDARDQVYKDPAQLKQEWGTNYNTYYAKSQQAVSATSGKVLKYNDELIVAYYHSTNNGRTENSVDVWGGDVPYLKSVSSSWDLRSPEYSKTVTMSYSEFRSRLGLPSTSTLSSRVLSRTDGDTVRTIEIAGRQYSGDQVRRSLGLRSNDFEIQFDGTRVTISTRGWGHHVGMSQYGAHYMGQQGYSYDQIIKHYYQGVSIVNL